MVRNIPSRTALAVVLIGVAVQSSLAFAPLFLVGRAPSLAGQRALGRVHRTYLSEQAQTRKPPGRILLRQTVTCKQEVTSGQVKTVLVVGGGLGGVSVVYDLRHKLRKHDRVILLSDRPAFEFTPSNPWVATRFRKPEDIRVPLAETLSKNGVEFKLGSATTLDAQGRVLTTDAGEAIAYDYLIVATGARLDFDAAPGVREHAVSICTTDHASHAADKWDAFLADDSAKNIVIGCMQGASCFGPGYEYALMLDNELTKRNKRDSVDITFMTSEPYVGHLGLGGVGGSQAELPEILAKHNIKTFANVRIEGMTASEVKYTQVEMLRETSGVVPSDFTMFIPPFAGQKVWTGVAGLASPNGQILVDEHMRALAFDSIFAIGAAVRLPAVETTPVPTGAPKTGFMIESMGTCAAQNIRSQIDAEEKGEDVHSASHQVPTLSTLCITDFGSTAGIALAIPQFKPRRLDVHTISPLMKLAKLAFEQYFLFKVRSGDTDPYYEKWLLKLVGLERMVDDHSTPAMLKFDKSPLPSRTETLTRD